MKKSCVCGRRTHGHILHTELRVWRPKTAIDDSPENRRRCTAVVRHHTPLAARWVCNRNRTSFLQNSSTERVPFHSKKKKRGSELFSAPRPCLQFAHLHGRTGRGAGSGGRHPGSHPRERSERSHPSTPICKAKSCLWASGCLMPRRRRRLEGAFLEKAYYGGGIPPQLLCLSRFLRDLDRPTEEREGREGEGSLYRGEGARVLHWLGEGEGNSSSERLVESAKRLFSLRKNSTNDRRPAARRESFATAAVWSKRQQGTMMNIFRLFGDMSHLASILVLLLKLRASKSAAGKM